MSAFPCLRIAFITRTQSRNFFWLSQREFVGIQVCSAGLDFWSNLPGFEMHTCIKIWDSEKCIATCAIFKFWAQRKAHFIYCIHGPKHSVIVEPGRGLSGADRYCATNIKGRRLRNTAPTTNRLTIHWNQHMACSKWNAFQTKRSYTIIKKHIWLKADEFVMNFAMIFLAPECVYGKFAMNLKIN